MKSIDEKISCMLNNIILNYFDLEDALSSVFDVSLQDFCDLKAEFDSAHEED